MDILDKIIERKKREVAEAKEKVSLEELKNTPLYGRTCYRLRDFVLDNARTGVIAEFKRASPSKGIINDSVELNEVVKSYAISGASAISVLTDSFFFKGSLDDLKEARSQVDIPLLRKDFVLDVYQIEEAKAYGADIILLIAAVLSKEDVGRFSKYAKALGLNVLLEIHNEEELVGNTYAEIDAIGVNNRNLKDFSVSIQHSLDLVDKIPDQYIKVSESGISDPGTIRKLKHAGFQAFLIGENFMKTEDPSAAVINFTKELRK
ncbi:indole-3-glycerol phosphate synthase TrpC [Olivibacter sp. SDN3]|uniref:indole-3-glycerol phosphate synthase TrpC n=1 Tax=Olivibacter sp. SDN3 TaxID=2764720 RepID=UPI001650F334|nr:indole-3-glycerol phosphate synthase TrpC [Olivibacter sp. SDN3]QNL51306.1 indole-3-glycerol phosphate synthase TrpC [Olivibacter sp. SDN3]